MTIYLLILSIVSVVIVSMDYFFYKTLVRILSLQLAEPSKILNTLGYYNKSIFPNRIYEILLILFVTSLIYFIHRECLKRKQKEFVNKINSLHSELLDINKGMYSKYIKKEDEFSILRDEIYKIIVSLKSMEEDSRLQKQNLKEDLSNIAHQIKTPITSIGFMSELIQMDKENTDVYIEKLNLELDRLLNFTEVLLKLSKINSDTIEYKKEEISIREVIEDILNRLNRENKVKISFKGDDIKIIGDDVWIYESFLNIIKNSLEYTKDEIKIEFSENPIFKQVIIKDNGKGITEESLNRIFDRFYRGNEATTTGYGIGLNLAKTIIEKHSGEIKVRNDNGVEFKIKFYNVI